MAFTPYSTVVAGNPALAGDWNDQVYGNGIHLFTSSGFVKRSVGGLETSLAGVTKGSALFAVSSSEWKAKALFTSNSSGLLKHEYGGLEADISAGPARGDILFADSSGVFKRLAAGVFGQHAAVSSSGDITWVTVEDPVVVPKTAAQTFASTVPSNDSHLLFDGTSSEIWAVDIRLRANNGGWVGLWSLPSGGVVNWHGLRVDEDASSPRTQVAGGSSVTAMFDGGGRAVVTDYTITSVIRFGDAGTAQLQGLIGSTATVGSSAVTVLHQGAVMIARRQVT